MEKKKKGNKKNKKELSLQELWKVEKKVILLLGGTFKHYIRSLIKVVFLCIHFVFKLTKI